MKQDISSIKQTVEEQKETVTTAVRKASTTSRLEEEAANQHMELTKLKGKVQEVEAQIKTGLGDVRKEVRQVSEQQEHLAKVVEENGKDTNQNLQGMEKGNKGTWEEVEKGMASMVQDTRDSLLAWMKEIVSTTRMSSPEDRHIQNGRKCQFPPGQPDKRARNERKKPTDTGQ